MKILTIRTKNVHQNSIFTLRTYIFELVLSLVEDPEKSSSDFMFIMNHLNYKLLEECLQQTYLRLIQINGLAREKHGNIENIDEVQVLLSEMYKQRLGDDINESIVFDQKLLIKSLYQIYKMLNIYSRVNSEVKEYLQRSTERSDPLTRSAFEFIFSIIGTIEYVDNNQQLETFHYLIPPKCYFLSSETKLQFEFEKMDRTNPQSKVASMLEVIPTLMIEMEENIRKYRKSRFQSLMVKIMISPKFHHK